MHKAIGPVSVLYVMAADAEYGTHLKTRFTPLVCGIGPVESAVNLTRSLAAHRPDIVVSLGSAGSRTLEQAGVYGVASVGYRDMDASPLGFERGTTPFLDLPAELPLTVLGAAPAKRLSTGAGIVSGAAYDGIDADMVDMETFALLRACMAFDVPLVGLRGISDGAEDLRRFEDWTQYLHVIDEKLAAAVDEVEAAIANGAPLS